MKIVTTKTDVLWNYAGTLVSLFSNFLLIPFLVIWLTSEELGLWYVYLAVGAFVTLFEFGFTPTFARNFAYVWSGADELVAEGRSNVVSDGVNAHLMSTVLRVCKRTYAIIALVALICMSIFGSIYVLYISSSIDVFQVVLSWIIFIIGTIVNLYYLYFGSLLRGIGKIAAENQIRIASRVVQLIVSVLLLFMGMGLEGAATGYLIYSICYRIGGYFSFWKDERISALKLTVEHPTKSELRDVFRIISHNASRDGLVMVSNYISTQAGTVICSLYLGLAEAGAFSIAMQFATAIGNLSLSLITSYRPMMQSAYQREDIDMLRQALGKGVFVYLLLYVSGTVIVSIFAYPILDIIKPNSSFNLEVYLAIALYIFLFDWHSMFSSVLASLNKIPYMPAYMITSLFCILVSVYLAGFAGFGVWGLILGFAIPQLMYNNWHWPLVVSREFGIGLCAILKTGYNAFRKK